MEEISKKDLLILTGISYGQLYRWKRKGLIPEEWFIKRASFTGQETYFPKDLILDRIDKILELKDDVSLEELSEIINSKQKSKDILVEELKNNNLFFNHEVLNLYTDETISFNDIVILKLMDNIYHVVNNRNEIKEFYQFICKHSKEIINDYKEIYIMTKDDKLTSILVKETNNIEYNLDEILKVNLKNLIDNIKLLVMV
ncbi:DUF4004 family protein [Mycoplasmatota bacterium]|nr:DUF4004 family protein [Mycoplasmatota bacterium]